jgi:hypothetical protein
VPAPVGRNRWPAAILIAAVLALASTANGLAQTTNADIDARRTTERTEFSDAEIRDGFLKTAFHAELQFGHNEDRIRKFDGPVRLFIADDTGSGRRADIVGIAMDIRRHIGGLDLTVVDDRRAANFVVMLVPSGDLTRTIRARYGAEKARQIEQKLAPQCLSGISRDQNFRIRRAEVLLPANVDDFSFYDCGYEELLQGLGVINDDNSVPWTMFNDGVQMGFFDTYDQYLLNILYDARVRPGMSKQELDRLLPAIMPAARDRIAANKRTLTAHNDVPISAAYHGGTAQPRSPQN